MAEDVRKWLASLGCEHYHPIFLQNGFNTVSSLSTLSERTLDRMAIINPSHRQAILGKASPVGEMDDIGLDFDAVLGDLTSAIADLESISVPTRPTSMASTNPFLMDQGIRRHTTSNVASGNVGTTSGSSSGSSTPLGGGTPHNSLSRQEKKPIKGHNLEASLQGGDFDLDALLDDLCEFDPMKEVGSQNIIKEASPAPVPAYQPSPSPQHVQVLRPANQPSPQHHHPPSPPMQTHPTQNGVKLSPSHGHESNDGHVHSLPRPYKMDEEDGGSNITPVHEPKFQGASQEISKEDVERRLEAKKQELQSNAHLSEEEVQSKIKDEKMMIALEKMKLASKRKEVIKVFNNDGSNKTVVIEDGMTAAVVCYLLVTKNHFEESPNWALIERLGDVGLERELEDHENVVDIYTHWARDSNNQFLFRRDDLKYELFTDPIKYFPSLLANTMIGKDSMHRADKARKILVQEYFTSALRVPELEGYLQLKDGYKNKWKKIYVILRASGIYQTLKGKAKTAKNLSLLVQFDEYELFRGLNFRKLLKAPTEHCFALRPKPDQMTPGAKDIKVLCADSEDEFISWFAGIRLAKHGHSLYDNYYRAHVKQFKLEETDKVNDGPTLEQKAYTLTGMRLEKHLDKKREMYQREKEAKEAQETMFRTASYFKNEDPQSHDVPRVPPKPLPKPSKTTGEPHHYPPPTQPAPPTPTSPSVAPHGEPSLTRYDSLSHYPWYHGAIPRDEAVRRLEQMGATDGVYLVRDSSSVPNSYVLTMFAKSVPKNFQIMPYEGPEGRVVFRIDDGPPFHTVDEVLNHYKLVADRLPCKLTEYCPRPPTRMTEC